MALGAVAQSLRGLPVAALAAALFAAYLIGLAVYRLCLSPLARFPGPKLAALSKWYEMYYEVAKKGQFTFRIQEMHKKYGAPAPAGPANGESVTAVQGPSSASPRMSCTSPTATSGMSCTPRIQSLTSTTG